MRMPKRERAIAPAPCRFPSSRLQRAMPVSTNAKDAIDCRPAKPVGELNKPSAINKMKNAFGEQAQESAICDVHHSCSLLLVF